MGIGFQVFHSARGIGIMRGWLPQRSEGDGSRTRMRSRAFVHNPRCAASSAIPKPGSLSLSGAQKNGLWLLWACSQRMVRPADAPGTRSVLRRPTCVPAGRGAAGAVQELWDGEARAARVLGRQSFLYHGDHASGATAIDLARRLLSE